MNKKEKSSNLGLLSLLCFLLSFFLIFNTDSIISSDNVVIVFGVLGLTVFSFILAIIGLVRRNQDRKNEISSVLTIVMIIGLFVLGIL